VEEASITFWLSNEGDSDRTGSELPLACRTGCTGFWSRRRAFRFLPRLVTPESNWFRFGPHSSPALLHPSHFSSLSPFHSRSGGIHYAPSVLRSFIVTQTLAPVAWVRACIWARMGLGSFPYRKMWVLLFVLLYDTDRIYSELSQP